METIHTIKRTTEPLLEIIRFYEAQGYTGGAKESDAIFLTYENNELICAVRVALENNVPVLRGMYMREDKRGKGRGRKILQAVEPTLQKYESASYCIPKTNLEKFYELIGFVKIEASHTPSFLEKRMSGYLNDGQDVILMKRECR